MTKFLGEIFEPLRSHKTHDNLAMRGRFCFVLMFSIGMKSFVLFYAWEIFSDTEAFSSCPVCYRNGLNVLSCTNIVSTPHLSHNSCPLVPTVLSHHEPSTTVLFLPVRILMLRQDVKSLLTFLTLQKCNHGTLKVKKKSVSRPVACPV